MSTLDLYEKVIEACQEKDLMSSSESTILSPILDVVCNGHHGGFERGCGLGWSRISRWGDSGNQASNYNIKQLTIELQNAKTEIEAMHARDKEREEAMKAREAEREEAMQAREREMQARMECMEAMLTMLTAVDTPFDSPRRNRSLRCRSLSRPFAAPNCSPERSPSPPSQTVPL
ncbi:hypothetical protein Taro_026291, partial [Colocasia esculenta]|nr:hypothetical protein [Colocasia esculenta]